MFLLLLLCDTTYNCTRVQVFLNSLHVVCTMFTCHILTRYVKIDFERLKARTCYTNVKCAALRHCDSLMRYALRVFIIFNYTMCTRNIRTEFIMRVHDE